MEYLNYLSQPGLMLLGIISLIAILLTSATEHDNFSMGKFILKNLPHFLINISFGIACMISDGKIITLIESNIGDFSYFLIGLVGGAFVKSAYSAGKAVAKKLGKKWTNLVN